MAKERTKIQDVKDFSFFFFFGLFVFCSFISGQKKRKDRHFYQLSIIIFYGGTFLCFHLLPIVEAVVNIFILSFCVLKLSCKGSCYINV